MIASIIVVMCVMALVAAKHDKDDGCKAQVRSDRRHAARCTLTKCRNDRTRLTKTRLATC